MRRLPQARVDPTPADLEQVAAAARDGAWWEVDYWINEVNAALVAQKGGPARAPWELLDRLRELYDTGHAVELARHGTPDELAAWLGAIYAEGQNAAAEDQRIIGERLERIWSAIVAGAGGTDGPVRPDWVAAAAAAPVLDGLEIRHRFVAVNARVGSRYEFLITPTMLIMGGQLGRIRVLRSRVTATRWLVFGGQFGSALNRFVFDNANGKREEHWDVDGPAATKVHRWLEKHGYTVPRITDKAALDAPGGTAQRHEV